MGSLTNLQLDRDSWNTALCLVSTPLHGMDEITQFWRLDQSWGQERSVSDYRASASSSDMLTNCLNLFATLVTASTDVDWRNRAVQITQCVMAELQSAEEPQIYLAFLEQFAELVGNLVDQRKVQDNDPLLFLIWQLLACADKMSTGKLGEPTRMLEDRLGGRWRVLSRATGAGYTHVTEETISSLFGKREYFRVPGFGVLLDRNRLTGRRWYIVIDFTSSAIRVMEGSIGTPVRLETGQLAVVFRGGDDSTLTVTLTCISDMVWWENADYADDDKGVD